MINAALALVERGFRVLPLQVGDKLPDGRLAHHGAHSATRDPQVIREWWRRSPRANIGIAPDSGLFVIDVDPRNNGHLSLDCAQADHGELPATLWQHSGGTFDCPTLAATIRGRHWFYQLPDACEAEVGGGEILPGVDIKGAGGYVVAAPSIHPNTGRAYEWGVPLETPIAIAPDWLSDLISLKSAGSNDALPQDFQWPEGEVYFDLPAATAAKLLDGSWKSHAPNRREVVAHYAYRLRHALCSPEQAREYMLLAAAAVESLSGHSEPYDVERWIERKLRQAYHLTPSPSKWRLRQVVQKGAAWQPA